MASIKYFGHSCFLIEIGGRSILTDPWFGNENGRIVPAGAIESEFRKVDFIAISHEHFDHCSPKDVEPIAQRTFAHVLGPREALDKISVNPRQKVSVMEGNHFEFLGVDVRAVKAVHPQSTHPVGYVFSADGQSVYFAGDTYDYRDMNTISCDVAILPIGGSYTMDSISAITALKNIKTKFVVPMHFNTFEKIKAKTRDFEERCKNSVKAQPKILEIGESFLF